MRRRSASLALLLALITVIGCATLAPGADPVVVRTEQALSAADAIYGEAMAYYFLPGKAATLPPKVVAVFEKVRTGYDAPYKVAQQALDTYKAAKRVAANPDATAVILATNELAGLINQVIGLFPGKAQAVKAGGV